MQYEWFINIIVVVVTVGLMTYFTRRAFNQAVAEILENQEVIASTEKIVEAQPETTQDFLKVVHRQIDLLEGLLKNAGLLDTTVIGKIIDKGEDFLEKVTNDTPEQPPITP